jgi:hypothetical protein
MINLKIFLISFITLYSLIVLIIYWRKYINKEQREFKSKEDKKKLFYILLPILFFTLHFNLELFVNYYNDLILTINKGYDQRFYIINESKFDRNFAINLYDKTQKSWVPYYRSDEFRLSPITTVHKNSECKLFVYLNKNEQLKYDKISFIYLNDYDVKSNKNNQEKNNIIKNDTLMNAITFPLPSLPLKIYSIDFDKNILTPKIKINNTFEYIKFVFYFSLIGYFVYFILMSKHQYLKFLYWLLNVIGVSACIYMIYKNTVYFVVLYNLF